MRLENFGWLALMLAITATASVYAKPKTTSKPIAAQTKALPIFDFMGSNTEEVSDMSQIDKKQCTTTADKVSCTNFNPEPLAGTPVKFITQDFYKGKIYHVFGDFGEYGYEGLLLAFTSKYGTASLETKKWESKGGAVFDNHVAIWRFKGGELELDSMGLDVNSGSFEFLSVENSPPAEAPKINF